MKRVLVVEDEIKIARLVRDYLHQAAGHLIPSDLDVHPRAHGPTLR